MVTASGQQLETANDGGLKVCYLSKLWSGLDIRKGKSGGNYPYNCILLPCNPAPGPPGP